MFYFGYGNQGFQRAVIRSTNMALWNTSDEADAKVRTWEHRLT